VRIKKEDKKSGRGRHRALWGKSSPDMLRGIRTAGKKESGRPTHADVSYESTKIHSPAKKVTQRGSAIESLGSIAIIAVERGEREHKKKNFRVVCLKDERKSACSKIGEFGAPRVY